MWTRIRACWRAGVLWPRVSEFVCSCRIAMIGGFGLCSRMLPFGLFFIIISIGIVSEVSEVILLNC